MQNIPPAQIQGLLACPSALLQDKYSEGQEETSKETDAALRHGVSMKVQPCFHLCQLHNGQRTENASRG